MRFLRKHWIGAIVVLVLLAAPGAWLMAHGTARDDESVVARVKKGEFKVVVTTSGELRARKFVQITLPANSQQAEAYQMKIASIVPEGTVVKEGDVVADLDRSTMASKLSDVTLALQKADAVNEQAMLDSTLNLSKAREDIRTMELGVEEKSIARDQAKFEAPSIKRQAEIDFTKAERAFAQAKLDYATKTEQAQAKMREVGADFERQKAKLKLINEVMVGFTIHAPSPGMVIYVKEWNGKKRAVGSQVSAWDPVVATLPDLTQMESMTYVNEIDVRKVAVGQPATITLDSDPSKRLKGTVTSVANVGEQRPNSDAKVFEVKINVEQADTALRPGMTTGNGIQTAAIPNVLFIPLEAVTNEGGISWVYKRIGSRVVKQEVETGTMNDDEVIIVRGLEANDAVLLSPPVDKDRMQGARLPGSTAKPVAPGGDTAATRKLQLQPPPKSTPKPDTKSAPSGGKPPAPAFGGA